VSPAAVQDIKIWQAGYDDGLRGSPYGTSPLAAIDELAYASGYIEGEAARIAKAVPAA
jgi:hypothetical protein